MIKHSALNFMLLTNFLFGCATQTIDHNPATDQNYEKTVASDLDIILDKCATSQDIESSLFSSDTVDFLIYEDGIAKDGIAYRSRNEISKGWAYCIQRYVKEKKFSLPPNGTKYFFKTEINWDAIVKNYPQLLTTKVKIKKTIHDNLSFLQQCYAEYTQKGGTKIGKINIEIELSSSGITRSAHAHSPDLKDANLNSCIETTFAKIKFPTLHEQSKIVFSYPIIFE